MQIFNAEKKNPEFKLQPYIHIDAKKFHAFCKQIKKEVECIIESG